ncbi:hypothetical protein [Desulfosporosinus sp. BG]|uniref:hypothetical protein n=1 Tax=Desulfosporosinus sp. BG TaxID=1633135 RepID=UPI00159F1141|nr:hypothetical protein [Desulfosporosinus sp. BG]
MRKVLDANVIVNSIVKGVLLGAKLIVSYTPWWLWLIIFLLGVLKVTTKKRSRG